MYLICKFVFFSLLSTKIKLSFSFQMPNSKNTVNNSKQALEQLEEELSEFYRYLKSNNFSDEDIQQIFHPLCEHSSKSKLIKCITYLSAILPIVVLLIYLNFDTIYWHATAVVRITLIKLLPYWDWQKLKYETCLIKKTGGIKTEKQDVFFNCDICESLKTVDAFETLDDKTIKVRYLDLDIPVILTNQSVGWPQGSNTSTFKIYSDAAIRESFPCNLASNIVNRGASVGKLFEKTELFDSFFMHFQNCQKDAMKSFRAVFPRPKFLHPEIKPIQYNWLLWNKNYDIDTFKRIELLDKFAVVGQISGTNYFDLWPRENCEKICTPLRVKLAAGEFLLLSSLWDLEYKPDKSTENLAVILETH